MYIALATALGLIIAAPLVGRWRANTWLKQNTVSEPMHHGTQKAA